MKINNINNNFSFKFAGERNIYEKQSNENLKENITKKLGDFCNFYDTNESKIRCVNKFVINSNVFKYKRTNGFVGADNLLKNGGDCKSWTTFYKGVFNYMGIHSNIIKTNNHVYLNAYDDTFYCNIDQKSIQCIYLQ